MIPAAQLFWLLGAGLIPALLLAVRVGLAPGLLWLAAFDLAVFTACFVDLARSRKRRVQVERSVAPRLSIGRDNPVQLWIQAPAEARIRLRDDHPFDRSDPPLALVLAADSRIETGYSVRPTERGEYRWGDLWVRQRTPWGLLWDSWRLSLPQTVAVYPDLEQLRALTIRLTQRTGGSLRSVRRLGLGTEFAEIRDYVSGDDPRLIDWKATARINRPLVRVLEPEQEQTLIVLLDRGRLMEARLGALRRFDWGLNAALALAVAALARGDRVGVGVFDRQMHTWIAPERGPGQLSRLIARLTPVQPELIEPDYLQATTAVIRQQPRRALVVLLTDLVDLSASAEMLTALARLLPRYLPFCVALRDPALDRQAADATPTVEVAYARAVALDLIAQRSTALARLRRRGALVLDAPADRVSTELVDAYLSLKARSLL
ncbi:DUF58 domain-containing protein [Gloeobacter kilaueensis]|uniref:DUF58 domain-containing protein n=1 Tax=Gloeobacter kilaueensis (strain ATCC BAA-2537 / CCAP 1431/1 / ULC 316 / JS1) TaxID=1183438 RepID=U5QJX8_GLOK1|nr:DUF58 domain-containing protein [Gloeobacter kilaueensis]AGY57904.1 hypothetical protein GKIL_1658 [Gloeobacter kilaueensis JS1]